MYPDGTRIDRGTMIIIIIVPFIIIPVIQMFVSGILGLVFNRRDDRMNVIRILGTIMFILQLLGFVGVLLSGDNILTSILGLLLPGFYILGAKDFY